MNKDFHFFSRVIVAQDFETVTFYVLFVYKYFKSLAVPNGLRIEHLWDIIPKAQSWLVLNLPVFMFVYIYFNVPSNRFS